MTECDERDPTQELLRCSDRRGEEESESVCGRLDS